MKLRNTTKNIYIPHETPLLILDTTWPSFSVGPTTKESRHRLSVDWIKDSICYIVVWTYKGLKNREE